MADWRFEFVDSTTQQNEDKLSSVIPTDIGSGINEKTLTLGNRKSKKTFSGEFENKLEKDAIRQYVVSPLNTVTGGLASPLYMSARKIARGATVGAVAGDLVATSMLIAVSYTIGQVQKRMQEIETQLADLGNTDNALIRAGSVSKATYYSGNFFSGVKSKTDRS